MLNERGTIEQRLELEHTLELEDRLARARKGLLNFTITTKPDYHIGWHHKLTCKYLNDFVEGKIPRLIITQPPRHGKSELTSRRLPAYIFGRRPNANIIGTSYSAGLASRMNRDVQRIIDSPEFRSIFPGVGLAGSGLASARDDWLRNSETFEIVNHGGVYRSAGVGGGITGMGGDFLLIDDPIKNQEEADSEVYREKLWDWYTSTLYTRLEKNGSILVTLTRWHEDDLVGRLLSQSKADPDADQWVILNLPAIAEVKGKHPEDPREEGEALWPEKYSEKRLKELKATVGSRVFTSLYQQRPSPAEGAIIKRKWLRYYLKKPDRFDEIIQSWDFTFKDTQTSAFVCGEVWGRVGADKYLLDEVRDRMDFIGSINAFRALTAKWPKAFTKLVEEKANGAAIINMLKSKISGIVPIEPEGSKDARLYSVQPEYEAGNVYYPDPSIAPWIHDHIEEIVGFPTAKYRDRVDTASQALNRLRSGANTAFTKGHIPNKISSITAEIRGAETW